MKSDFIQIFKLSDGTIHKWYYNKGQLIETTATYPSGYLSAAEEQKAANKKLPKTKQRFVNPLTGREVSYQRAKELGIIKK